MQKRNNTETPSKDSAEKNPDHSLLEEFFIGELKDLYWAEKHLTKVLPKMAKAATSDALKNAFEEHLKVTEGHVTRLEEAFDILGHKAQAKKCEAMEGITKEGDEIVQETQKGTATRDAGLILAGHKAEHYEIASYGGLIQIAKTLNHQDIADLLQDTFEEEKEADETLSKLAEEHINSEAKEEVQ